MIYNEADITNMDHQKLDKTLQYFSEQSRFCHTWNVTKSSDSQKGVLFLSLLYEAEHGDEPGKTLNITVRLIVHVMPVWATLNETLLFITAKQREARLQHRLPLSLTALKPLAPRRHSLLLSAAVRRSHVVHLSSTLLWARHNHSARHPHPTRLVSQPSAQHFS